MSRDERGALFDQPSSAGYYYEGDDLRRRVPNEELMKDGLPRMFLANTAQLNEAYINHLKVWLSGWKRGGEKPDKSLYIAGEVHRAEMLFTHAIRNVAHRCFPIQVISAIDLAEKVKDPEKLHKLYEVSCLGIYDFGLQHRDRDGYYDHFFIKVLSARTNALLPTVILSSYTHQELKRNVFIALVNPNPEQANGALSSKNILRILERSFEEIVVE